MKAWSVLAVAALLLAPIGARAQLVINEIFYHAPEDLAELQWIELHNASDGEVSLSGWRLAKGVTCAFPKEAAVPARGYAVVCKNREVFGRFYETPVVGVFEKSLKENGERVELLGPGGRVVDSLEYKNRPPWPRSPDGGSASLERVCPGAPGNTPENWTSSPLSEDSAKPGGTPGRQNAAYSATPPPTIKDVTFKPTRAQPGEEVRVEARVHSQGEPKEVALLYRVVGSGSEGEEKTLPMSRQEPTGRFTATIPGQPPGSIIRFRVRATDAKSAQRLFPGPFEPQPALSCLVFTNVTPGKIPLGFLIHTDPEEARLARDQRPGEGRGRGFNPADEARFMVEMQFRTLLDLPSLWADLTLTNSVPGEINKLRPVFLTRATELEQLKRNALAAKDPREAAGRLPETVKSFKTSVADSLQGLLTPEQTRTLEAWRNYKPDGQGPMGMGGNPEMMLRQFVSLEPAYLWLATATNTTPAQLSAIQAGFQKAIEERSALVPLLRKLMGGPREPDDQTGQDFQAKAEAIEPALEARLKPVLSPEQVRAFRNWQEASRPAFMRRGGTKETEPAQGKAAFVYVDPKSGEPVLYDFAHIPQRSGGWKVHFSRGQNLNGMTGINLIFEANDRWLLAEALAYDLHRRAGNAAPLTGFVRLWVDGQPVGYHLLVEQPNKAFLRRNKIRDDGNLYKANWTGRGLTGQHDKRSNIQSGHEDLVELVNQLEQTKNNPSGQWNVIQREFDVPQMVNHYAVRMLIADWDGFFNNYFLYHDIHGTKKWTLYPWDEDKTWGDYDGSEQGGLLYNMPLGYGAEGDRPPGARGDRPTTSFGFGTWWRAGGYLSRPLLANPAFRQKFLGRLRELIDSEFTAERLFPLVDSYGELLREEVRLRAEVAGEKPEQAVKHFESNLASFKELVTKRRQWMLEQPELKLASASPGTGK